MKRAISLLMSLLLLFTLVPMSVFADTEEEQPTLMTGSEKMYNYIKGKEGCSLTAYKNPGETNWTIGYGHCDETIKEGDTITQEEADALFLSDIAAFEEAVRNIESRYGYELTQNEFDALLSLCYNFGTHWVEYYSSSWRLARYIKNDFHKVEPLELVDSMAVLCNAGTVIYEGLISRRFEEAKILLYGVYPGDELPCPDFVYIIMDADGGSISGGNRVKAYYKDEAYGSLPTATKEGCIFDGWVIKGTTTPVTENTVAEKNLKLVAQWSEDPDYVAPDPVDPVDPEPTPTPEPEECDGGENCPSKKFTDVRVDYWGHDAIDYAVSEGLFKGMSETEFGPDLPMTRGMLVTVLYRMNNSPDVTGYENPFSDVENSGRVSAYYDAILWASHNRIANGYPDGTFMPDGVMTREELATFLYRYASNIVGKDTDNENYSDLSGYTDTAKINASHVVSLEWAVGQGLIKGMTDTTLDPKESATRAQLATLLMRFIENYI